MTIFSFSHLMFSFSKIFLIYLEKTLLFGVLWIKLEGQVAMTCWSLVQSVELSSFGRREFGYYYQMLISSGKYETFCKHKKSNFRCVINLYFFPFFIDHPVVVRRQPALFVSFNHNAPDPNSRGSSKSGKDFSI